MSPQSRYYCANGLRYHLWIWEPAQSTQSLGTVALGHGFLDIGWSWQRVALLLAEAGYRVMAWDWRGHGKSDWVGAGGYYYFTDYIADLAALMPQLDEEPLHLVGHSMGSTASAMYAGTHAAHIQSLVLIEGLGPFRRPTLMPATRVDRWLQGAAKARDAGHSSMPSIEAAYARLKKQHPFLDAQWGVQLAEQAVRSDERGGYVWRFDPLHKTLSPIAFSPELFASLCTNIKVPTTAVFAEHGFRSEDEDQRLSSIAQHRRSEIANAGHMIHWSHPHALARCLLEHLRWAGTQ